MVLFSQDCLRSKLKASESLVFKAWQYQFATKMNQQSQRAWFFQPKGRRALTYDYNSTRIACMRLFRFLHHRYIGSFVITYNNGSINKQTTTYSFSKHPINISPYFCALYKLFRRNFQVQLSFL